MTNDAATNLAKLRWAKTTPEQRSAHAKMMVSAREKGRKRRAKKKCLAQDKAKG